MLRLTTFGGLVLQQDGQLHTGPAAQRRRLALLAIVASAGRRGVSRDKLLSVLWPDSDPEPARHSLYQALHAIRRSLGSDQVFLGTATLQFNPELIGSDVAEFEEAVEQGAHEGAARLYRGPFLDGFRLEGAPEFERWQDGERLRHAREYAAALEALAAAAAARGDQAAAARWWRRLAAAEPVSTRAALGLIESLVASGDRAGALQFAGVHAALVRQHLETEPDPLVEQWIGRLRSGDVPAAPPTPASASRPRAGGAEDARDAAAREVQEIKRVLAERYQVGDRTAEGTILLTFAARDRRDTRPVELHVLNPRLAALGRGARVVERLERVAALHEPRIVPLRECGMLQGVVYFATPPVEGPSLRDRLARDRQLPLDEARRIAGDLLEALAYAHGRDVRHGDLRPKHVLLGRAGIAVTGFGLVEALDLAEAGNAGSTAVTIGAPAYLSPEQLAGETTADERSDLYSLGCLLFEMLAGEPPFSGSNLAAVLSRKLTLTAPPVRTLRDSVSPALEAFVARALSRLPADRFQHAAEAREALRAVP
ncbi:MAG TPA: protein kinase [Gemmatimonadales bacterium]|nr:protein kinase [Gemmatimonadales bacterium]